MAVPGGWKMRPVTGILLTSDFQLSTFDTL